MKSYSAELLAVGSEILLGNIVNTDSQYIAQELSTLGINVYFQTVVGDNPERLRSAVEIAASRSDIIITTGGLGPTSDDLTKETVAACFGKKLVFFPEEAEKIKAMFRRLGKMTENNLRQAMLPEGCTVLENTCGTAPGCAFRAEGKLVIMLPGPPRECKPMFDKAVRPILSELYGGCLVSRNVRVFGLGESAMEAALYDLILNSTNPTVAPYAKTGEAMLRVTARAETPEEAYAMTEPVIRQIYDTLPDCIYGVDCDSLEQRALELMLEKGLTFSAAESCTGGLVSKRVTDVAGSSGAFLGSVVSYSNDVKVNVLGVDPNDLASYGAVSEPVALQMARGARRVTGSDISVGITGIAGPASDGSDKPVGLVFVALDSDSGAFCRRLELGTFGGREMIRERSANTAFDMVIRLLTGRPVIQKL